MVRVTGIDLGSSCLHLVELEGSARKYRVSRIGRLPVTPAPGRDEPENGVASAPAGAPALAADLKAVFQQSGAARDRTLLAVAGSKCILRNITLPFRGRDEIRKVLKFEAESHIHSHSIDDVVVDAIVVDEREEGTELFMAACPKDVLATELDSLRKLGVDPERADLAAAALVAAASNLGVFGSRPDKNGEPANEGEDGPTLDLILDIGAHSIQMVLVRAGELWTARVLRWGVERLEDDMGRHLSITPREMRIAFDDYFGRGSTTADTGEENDPADAADAISPVTLHDDDLREASRSLAHKIVREVTRFMSGFNLAAGPGRLLLSGGGSRLPGLREALAEASGLAAEPLDLLGRSGTARAEAPEPEPDLDVAFAAALAAIGATRPAMNFRQENLAFRPKFDRLKLPLAISLLTLTILLLFLAMTKLKDIRRIDSQIGIVAVQDPKGKRVVTHGKRLPTYTGLLAGIAHPQRERSYLQNYLRPPEWQPILEALPDAGVHDRTRQIVRELRKIKRRLERETGYFAEVQLESGLAVLQAFSEAVDGADKAAKKRFVIPRLHLQVGASRAPGYLTFTVSFRGGEDFRQQNEHFLAVLQRAVREDGAFAKLEQDGPERIYRSSLNEGAEYPYKFTLNDQIPVFQPKDFKSEASRR